MIKLLLVDFQSYCICLYTLVVQRVFDSTKLSQDFEIKRVTLLVVTTLHTIVGNKLIILWKQCG